MCVCGEFFIIANVPSCHLVWARLSRKSSPLRGNWKCWHNLPGQKEVFVLNIIFLLLSFLFAKTAWPGGFGLFVVANGADFTSAFLRSALYQSNLKWQHKLMRLQRISKNSKKPQPTSRLLWLFSMGRRTFSISLIEFGRQRLWRILFARARIARSRSFMCVWVWVRELLWGWVYVGNYHIFLAANLLGSNCTSTQRWTLMLRNDCVAKLPEKKNRQFKNNSFNYQASKTDIITHNNCWKVFSSICNDPVNR